MKEALVTALFVGPVLLAALSAPAAAQSAGAAVYKAKCAMCHGADGRGETPMGKLNKLQDLASPDVQKLSDTELTAIITSGKNKMPAYGKSLKEAEIKDVVAFIRDFAKK